MLAKPPLLPLARASTIVTVLPVPTVASAKLLVPLVVRVSVPTSPFNVPKLVTAVVRPSKVLSVALCPVMVSALRVTVALLLAPAAVRLGVW